MASEYSFTLRTIAYPTSRTQKRTLEALRAVFPLSFAAREFDGSIIVGWHHGRLGDPGKSVTVDRNGRVHQNQSTQYG